MDESRLVQVNANKWPVIIGLVAVNSLTIHLKHALVSEASGHVLENLLLLTLTWNNQSKVEFGWDTESKHTINVSSNNFEMHEGSEELLEAGNCDTVKTSLSVLKLFSKLTTCLLVLFPLSFVVGEGFRHITLSSECLDYIISVIFVYDNTVNLILIFVL